MKTYSRKRKRGGEGSNSNPSSSKSESKSDDSKWPTDILEEITRRLDSRIEILRFRAICKELRASIPLPPRNALRDVRLPRKLPFPTGERLKGKDRLLLIQNIIYSLEPQDKIQIHNSSDGHKAAAPTPTWFVKIEDSKFGKVRINNPLSRFKTDNLRKVSSLPKVINLLDYRVRVVAKEYSIRCVIRGKGRPRVREFFRLKKVVVAEKKVGEFVVMVIHETSGRLAVWKMGQDEWVEIGNGVHFEDIAYHKGRFYAVDSTRRIVAVDSSSLDITLVAPPPPDLILGPRLVTYLVKSLDDLYLIHRSNFSGFSEIHLNHFPNVYKLDEELGKWVDSAGSGLRDRVMFLGQGGNSYSVPAGEFDGCKDNCIYFRYDFRDSMGMDFVDYPGRDVALYDFGKHEARRLNTVEGYSELFWPPPAWLGSNEIKPPS